MPPRLRANKASKGKENVTTQTKPNIVKKTTKSTRKVLADKTNSASDDNASIELAKSVNIIQAKVPDVKRRERRLPKQYVENQVLKNLSNHKNVSLQENVSPNLPNKTHTTPKIVAPEFKTPEKAEEILLIPRPRRICRLPSKFDNHLTSPNKFIPAQNQSTPIIQHANRHSKNKEGDNINVIQKRTNRKQIKTLKSKSPIAVSQKSSEISSKTTVNRSLRNAKNSQINNPNFDTSSQDNATSIIKLQSKRTCRLSAQLNKHRPNKTIEQSDPPYSSTPITQSGTSKKQTSKHSKRQNNLSFRVLDDKQHMQNKSNVDIYEFTYDPNEEPPPQKKKRKKAVRKRPAKPKTFNLKSNYEQKLSQTLATLKNKVAKTVSIKENVIQPTVTNVPQIENNANTLINASVNNSTKVPELNYISMQLEDIAADIQPSISHEINYSPINSPCRKEAPEVPDHLREPSVERAVIHDDDPLCLRADLNFFDEPVASSSMNASVRHCHGSPWRVEFGSLPIKWHVNSYVKANMTPAVECSFVNFEDNKKKHVYTNMVPESSLNVPEIVINEAPNLKQTSILSFIKEVIERSAKKNKRGRSVTPPRVLNPAICAVESSRTPDKILTPRKSTAKVTPSTIATTPLQNISNVNDSTNTADVEHTNIEARNSRKNNNNTYFGFDDSDQDQENVSPNKKRKLRALRPRARAVLKEINEMVGPSRAMIPIAAKSKPLAFETVTKQCEEMKSASDAPLFPEKNDERNKQTTNVEMAMVEEEDNDEESQSVHLFEDIDVVHHLKPVRKSYGKAKKVAFRQNSVSGSDTQDSNVPRSEDVDSHYEDDFNDLTFVPFEIPEIQEKKTKKKKDRKQKLTRKEVKEAEEWAAGFNSMCEEIEDFPLVVE